MSNQKPMSTGRLDLAWRSVVIALVYILAQIVLDDLLIGPQGSPQGAAVAEFYFWEAIAVLAIALLVGFTFQMNTSNRHTAVIWFIILFFNAASVIIEGTFYSPVLVGSVWVQRIIASLIASLAAAGAIGWLLPAKSVEGSAHPVKPRSWLSWAWRFIISSMTYLATYLVFGALNYMLVTKPYYDAHAGGLTVPGDPLTVLIAESVRAPMIVVAVLPLTLAMSRSATRRRTAVVAGLVLFVVGGVVPLLPDTALPLFLRVASLWEIFSQNFVTGLVIGLLLGYAPQTDIAPDKEGLQPSMA